MTERVEITRTELALILEALDDAAYYRGSRSRVLKGAARRRNRRSPSSPTPPTITMDLEGTATEIHRRKAQD